MMRLPAFSLVVVALILATARCGMPDMVIVEAGGEELGDPDGIASEETNSLRWGRWNRTDQADQTESGSLGPSWWERLREIWGRGSNAEDPPADDPPADDPPADDPPAEDPPADDPPSDINEPPTEDEGSGSFTLTLEYDGSEREFDVFVPSSYDPSAATPVVLDFHGWYGNKRLQASSSGFRSLASQEGFIAVHPQGVGNSWNAGICCGTAQQQGLDDVGFAVAVVDRVTESWYVDRRRVYATGLSNGGALSHRLACEAADVFAAVAPVSFTLSLSSCEPSRPISVIHFHGYGDTMVSYSGGMFGGAQQSFATWGEIDSCSGPVVTTFERNESMCETLQTCGDGTEVTLCSIDGPHGLYSNADNVNIASIAWETLSRFSLP